MSKSKEQKEQARVEYPTTSASFNIPTQQGMVTAIDAFCEKHSMGESTFSKRLNGDPNFMREMRGGRDLRLSMVHKIFKFMKSYGAVR